MKKMFKVMMIAMLAFGLMGLSSFARSSGGSRSSGGFSRSSSKSYSSTKKSYKPSTGVAKAKPKAYTKSTKPSTVKKTSGGFGKSKVNPKSASYKKTNSMIKKDFGTSNKKYSNMKEAKSDLGSKMATKSYSHSSPKVAMANRPTYVPTTYQGHNTVYMGGRYGYYDPMGSFMAYGAMHMIISDSMMHSYAPNAYNSHVVVHRRGAGTLIFSFLFGFIIVAIIFGIVRTA